MLIATFLSPAEPLWFGLMMVWLFNPIWISIIALIAVIVLLKRTGLWARYRYRIFLVPIALFVVDSAFAIPRVLFSYRLPDQPVVAQTIALPRQLVLVNVRCLETCHSLLMSGAIEDLILVKDRSADGVSVQAPTAYRYRAAWTQPGTCPRERVRLIEAERDALLRGGFCPIAEPVDVPAEGIFVIHEHMWVSSSQRARTFRPVYLVQRPPGRAIRFTGSEVQRRSASGVEVLASNYSYEAPGFLGLPPMVGCWDRPHNVIWIMPPGDTGCGFWRLFTLGGDRNINSDALWTYLRVFTAPDRTAVPPQRPDLSPPTPTEALEILTNAGTVEDYLPKLRDILLDASNTDEALTDLIVKRVRRGRLEGSLIALLAQRRPSAISGLVRRVADLPVPLTFVQAGDVLAEMENTTFRNEIADTMLRALAATWSPRLGDHFLDVMATHDPEWLCARLGRLTGPDGLLATRSKLLKIYREKMPPFLPPLLTKAVQQCPDASADFVRALLSEAWPVLQEEIVIFVLKNARNLAPALAVQAVVNLSLDIDRFGYPYTEASRKNYYQTQHRDLLRAAAHPCEKLTEDIDAYVKREKEQQRDLAPLLLENLNRIKNRLGGEFCRY
jgi:hypothetical protein